MKEDFILNPPNTDDYPYVHLVYTSTDNQTCECDVYRSDDRWVIDRIYGDDWHDYEYDSLDAILNELVSSWGMPTYLVESVKEMCEKLTPELMTEFIAKRNKMMNGGEVINGKIYLR